MPEEDIDVDGFLDSDETVEELMQKEYGVSDEEAQRSQEFWQDLQPQVDTRDVEEAPPASPDEELIKGRGIAMTDVMADDMELDGELSKDEEMVAQHGNDTFEDPALNAVYKSTTSERARRERAMMSKRELLDIAGDMVDEYFRKNVKTDGIDESRLNQLKFAARRRVAQKLTEDA